MARVRIKQVFLRPGAYRVNGRRMQFTPADLREIVANTKRLLSAGIRVPLWSRHTPPGDPDGGPQELQFGDEDARANMGWMVDVRQLHDGSLEQTLDVLDEGTAKAIRQNRIRYTSPEIGEYIDGIGRAFGRVIRHMALTATPRNPNQGPFTPVVQFSLRSPTRPAIQFSLDDRIEDSMDTDPEAAKFQGFEEAALVNDLEALGVSLPAGWNYREGFKALCGAVHTAAEQNRRQVQDGFHDTKLEEQSPPMAAQFSEGNSLAGRRPRTISQARAKNAAIHKSLRSGK